MTNKTDSSAPTPHVTCNIEIDNDVGVVMGKLVHARVSSQLTRLLLNERLARVGVSQWAMDESGINVLINKFRKGRLCHIAIAHKKDATFHVTVNPDGMTAYIDVHPAQGGKGILLENLIGEMINNSIDLKRVNHAGLNQVIAALTPMAIVVASGKNPVPGLDTQFKPLIVEQKIEHTEEDKTGRIDYLSGKSYVTISADMPLMERIPSQTGKMGIDIFGQIIPATAGKDIPFAKEMAGTFIAADNPDLLMAEISGHPVFFYNGARVDKSLQFENIDLTTGHIKFDGSVLIKGDVRPDMKIEVSGDVFIKGAVERASIKAGNDITINGGVLGNTLHEYPQDGLPPFECFLDAGGSIEAKYINLAMVKAMKDIRVKEYVFNSQLTAGAKVCLGQNGGRGNLVGGETKAGHSVIGKVLGSKAYLRTHIRVGPTLIEFEYLKKLRFIRNQRITQARRLREILILIKAKNHIEKIGALEINKAKKIHTILLHLQEDLSEINCRMTNIGLPSFDIAEPHITATSACYPNCFITLNDATKRTHNEHKATSYIKKNDKITTKP
ncbi:FapA family protein [Reinekea sp.]|jgi:uncharacterized protein (DUF342 family)|uniref:DUF342 domain-containing protein n=1 Tax=Reinekea sp. TaxID=1970455 RepID=UPI002A830BAC|nr:FapA family protein [Reinekea sp.]